MQAVVLSGGVGSRLWPISNETCPKPFIRLDDNQSLLQKTFLRAANISSVSNITVVANCNFLTEIQNEYSEIEKLIKEPMELNCILEPFGKNTMAAIAAAALQIEELYGLDEVMLVLPADHLISNHKKFEEAVLKAHSLALKGALVTLGVKPDNPEVGYGYIKYSGNNVEKFIEKPTLKLAQEFCTKDNFLWNSGMFCFTAGNILKAMSKHCSFTLDNVRCALNLAKRINRNNIELNSLAFSLVPEESIDYAIMEKSKKIAVVPCDIGWKDVGTWDSMSKLSPVDSDGNRVKGKATLHDVSNCYIENNGQLIGAVGVKDLAIINTKNGLLVTNKHSSNAVRNIYSQLQKNIDNIQKYSWGDIKKIQDNHEIKINQITINSGSKIENIDDFQYTANWIITRGSAQFVINNLKINCTINESKYILKGSLKTITNISTDPLVIITIQLDDYLSRNDIITSTEINKASNG